MSYLIYRLRSAVIFIITCSGHSALSPDGTRLAAWNLAGTLNIYDLKLQMMIKRIPIAGFSDLLYNKEVGVAWIHGGNGVVIGSNFGLAAVVDIGLETVVQLLQHSAGNQHLRHLRCFLFTIPLAVPRNVHIHSVVSLLCAVIGVQVLTNSYRLIRLSVHHLLHVSLSPRTDTGAQRLRSKSGRTRKTILDGSSLGYVFLGGAFPLHRN